MSVPRLLRPRRPRGMSLIEVMAASAVLAIGLVGLTGSQVTAARRLAYSGREVQATALAQELASVLSNVPYAATGTGGSALLGNTTVSNDGDITDSAGTMDSVLDPVASNVVDHQESELPTSLTASLTPINATAPGNPVQIFQRYWTIKPIPDPLNPSATGGVYIAAVVRYRLQGSLSYRHVAVVTTRFDPTKLRQ